MITEAKYGFSCREGALGVSLLRSPHVTGQDPGHGRLSRRRCGRGPARPDHSDHGRHVIRLALAAHTPALPREHLAPTLADTLFTPPLAYRGAAVSAGLLGLDGLASVVPAWAKPAADGEGWILRLHETLGRRGPVKLRLAEGRQAYRTDLSEATVPRRVREIAVRPYELVSVHVR
ncbi:MAG: glycosyl hydrolase-related protein [Verrucomicrobiota bacterium]